MDTQPDKLGGAIHVSGSGSNAKNSIFGVVFKTPRDPEHNKCDLMREIKSDMVNEMI